MSGGPLAEPGTVAIAGGGLIGTSLALALAAEGHRVRIHEPRAETRTTLADVLTALPEPAGGRPTVGERWDAVATGADVVIAAVPPGAIATVLAEGAAVAASDALLTDVAGTKQGVVADVARALPPAALARYVGGHPMAGSERSGPTAADATLFSGVTWVLTPTAATADTSLAAAGELVRAVGGRALVLSAEEHDTIVGLVSHLPQLVASVLADVAAEAVDARRDAVMAVAGPGFRDTTRIAASDAALWLDIVAANRPAVLRALEAFRERLDTVATAVASADETTLGDVLRRASAARRRLLPKELAAPTRDLIVPLRDRPGELARITAALGSAGINIEDLGIRHATAADRGSLQLRVRADDGARALTVLAEAGFGGVDATDTPGTPGTPGTPDGGRPDGAAGPGPTA